MNRLTQKLGPLPLWAWAVIGLAVLGIGYYIYKNGGLSGLGGGSGSSPASAGDSGLGGLGIGAYPPLGALGGGGQAGGSGGGPGMKPPIGGLAGGGYTPPSGGGAGGDGHRFIGPPDFGGPNRGSSNTRAVGQS